MLTGRAFLLEIEGPLPRAAVVHTVWRHFVRARVVPKHAPEAVVVAAGTVVISVDGPVVTGQGLVARGHSRRGGDKCPNT